MLRIHSITTKDHILHEDLTATPTTAEEVKPYFRDLRRLCQEHDGLGISASQVGLRLNFFFVAAKVRLYNRKEEPQTCINPTWRPRPKTEAKPCKEGCLSIKGRSFMVDRFLAIDAEWNNAVGHRLKAKLLGRAAQVFQHEYDHLKGLTLLETGVEIDPQRDRTKDEIGAEANEIAHELDAKRADLMERRGLS